MAYQNYSPHGVQEVARSRGDRDKTWMPKKYTQWPALTMWAPQLKRKTSGWHCLKE